MSIRPCPTCGGKRLRPEALSVTVDGSNIYEVTHMAVEDSLDWVRDFRAKARLCQVSRCRHGQAATARQATLADLAARQSARLSAHAQSRAIIAHQVLKEIAARLQFMVNVGLDYLTLDRTAATLSGGEAQRIRLATQIGSQLMGVLYILDEPSIGLHQRDNARLIDTLEGMRDLGNTVLVVEHDEDTIRAADWVVDMGPGAGEHGGEVVCSAPQVGLPGAARTA